MRRSIAGLAPRCLLLGVLAIFLLVHPMSAQSAANENRNKTASIVRDPPADIDEQVPPVHSDVPCPLPKLLHETGQRTLELVANLQRFSAVDRVDDVQMHKNGQPRAVTSRFHYVAEIKQSTVGPSVEEYRDRTSPDSTLQTHWEDAGTAAFALIFHPHYIQDYLVTCEGLGEWQGKPAWQLRFAQNPERGNAFHVYRVSNGIYPVRLKGRAWISPDDFEVLRVETDLLQPVPQIRLEREHSIVEYGPVGFKKHGVQLWLPQTAELYIDHRGHRYHRRHTFSNFQLFWVETAQQIKEPQPPDKQPQD